MKNQIVFIFLFCCSMVSQAQPLNDIVDRKLMQDQQVLAYPPIREVDIMWEKRIWRVIDVREKMNLPFVFPDMPFFDILTIAAQKGEINLYGTEDDKFSYVLSEDEIHQTLFQADTIEVLNENFEAEFMAIENNLYYEDVKRFRIQELWYFDSNTSTMKVRILGIAPLIAKHDENGNFQYEFPLFWVNYAELRPVIAKHSCFNQGNDKAVHSWEDIFEMRYFASTIYKENDVLGRRITDYLSGVDALHESEKIRMSIFNYEHDLWSW